MREVNKVKVIDALPAHLFEPKLQETLDQLAQEGFKTEATIEITTSRYFMAVVIGKREPFAKSPNIETKIEVGKNVTVELDGNYIAKGIVNNKSYSDGLDYSRKQNRD